MTDVRDTVRQEYGKIAAAGRDGGGCCGPASSGEPAGGCGSQGAHDTSRSLGYSEAELARAPDAANLGLGCANPQTRAAARPGETVLDLGSGGGLDSFLAADQVGATGRVIGVDMTPEMISLARESAAKVGADNVEFRLGEIEHLPVADKSIDLIISNCVINLSPDKSGVFREAFRALRSGGRLAIADVVAWEALPSEVQSDPALHVGCVAGAWPIADLETLLREIGFTDVRVKPLGESRETIREWAPGQSLDDYVVSAMIEATRP